MKESVGLQVKVEVTYPEKIYMVMKSELILVRKMMVILKDKICDSKRNKNKCEK